MKQVLVLPLLLSAIVIATMIHSVRVNTYPIEDSFDKLSDGLKDIGYVLPPSTNISFRPIDVSIEEAMFCNYLLAPRLSRANKEQKPDTALVLCSWNTKDSMLHAAMGKNVIWSNKDDKYRYYLTTDR